MGQVVRIHSSQRFTKDEALDVLPIIKRITGRASAQVEEIQEQLRFIPEDEPAFLRLKGRIQYILSRWVAKVTNLGANPRGVWLVDFDAGEGWFSWRYGDEDLTYFNSHHTSNESGHFFEELLT
jgi:hypothetical protein